MALGNLVPKVRVNLIGVIVCRAHIFASWPEGRVSVVETDSESVSDAAEDIIFKLDIWVVVQHRDPG